MRGFDVNQFRSILEKNDQLLPTNKFLVELPQPKSFSFDGQQAGNMSFYCKSTSLPGVGVLTKENNRYGIGPIQRKPYATVVNDIIMQFYVDALGLTRTWMLSWVRSVINADSRNGMNSPNAFGTPYALGYMSEYAVDIKITSFTQEGTPKLITTLIDAYPNYVGDIGYDWGTKSDLMIMPVSFTYRDWYEENQGLVINANSNSPNAVPELPSNQDIVVEANRK